MKIITFIEKAIEGGWNHPKEDCSYCETPVEVILLDPLAWQAVGKVEGWQDVQAGYRESDGLILYESGWKRRMHRMIDALAEGKTITQFLETL